MIHYIIYYDTLLYYDTLYYIEMQYIIYYKIKYYIIMQYIIISYNMIHDIILIQCSASSSDAKIIFY